MKKKHTKRKTADSATNTANGKEKSLNSILTAENSKVKTEYEKIVDICYKLNSDNLKLVLAYTLELAGDEMSRDFRKGLHK